MVTLYQLCLLQEEFRRVKVLRAGGKVRGVSVAVNSDTAALSVLTANNIVEQFRMDLEEKEPECSSIRRLEHPGHRSGVILLYSDYLIL